MSRYFGQQFLAVGRVGLPKAFVFGGVEYRLCRVFKHDFFAATALYDSVLRSGPGGEAVSLVLKLSRQRDFLGVPLAWLGHWLRDHEYKVLQHLQGIEGVAHLVGRYGTTGMLYEYVKGQSLDESPEIPNTFFEQLEDLLDRIHACDVAYIDMNKRGNILLRPDGRPLMIDFQISWHVPKLPIIGLRCLAQYIFRCLVEEDVYHLMKHKRRLRPDLMNESEISASRRISSLIGFHRLLAIPFRRVRRKFLSFLSRKNILPTDQSQNRSPENDPSRWVG